MLSCILYIDVLIGVFLTFCHFLGNKKNAKVFFHNAHPSIHTIVPTFAHQTQSNPSHFWKLPLLLHLG